MQTVSKLQIYNPLPQGLVMWGISSSGFNEELIRNLAENLVLFHIAGVWIASVKYLLQ